MSLAQALQLLRLVWERVLEESKDGGRTWTPILYIMRISTGDGKEYEVRYKKTG